jgi:hypothetical protein
MTRRPRRPTRLPKMKHEVSPWLQERLDVLNRASVGGWFDELERSAASRGQLKEWWERLYARGAELFGEDFKGIRSVTVAYYTDVPSAGSYRLRWRARRPSDGDHL